MPIKKDVKLVKVIQQPSQASTGGALTFSDDEGRRISIPYQKTGVWFEVNSDNADKLAKSDIRHLVKIKKAKPSNKKGGAK